VFRGLTRVGPFLCGLELRKEFRESRESRGFWGFLGVYHLHTEANGSGPGKRIFFKLPLGCHFKGALQLGGGG